MIVESEFASILTVMKRQGNTLSATLRNAWDIDDLNIITKNNPLTATDTHISMIGHTTKDDLMSNLDDVSIRNGLANRFLLGYVERSKSLPFGGNINKEYLDWYIRQFKLTLQRVRDDIEEQVTFDEQSRDLWADIYEDLSKDKLGIIGALTSRAEAYVRRLAVCYALLDCTDKITVNHLNAALAVWRYVESSTRYIFRSDKSSSSSVEMLASRILIFLMENRATGKTRTEISTFLGNNTGSQNISDALKYLLDEGNAYPKKVKTDGRSKEVWKAR